MQLTPTQKELISRGTMATFALLLAAVATKLLFVSLRSAAWSEDAGAGDGFALGQLLLPVIVLLYLVAITFGCFVFSARDPRRSNVGRVMHIADQARDGLSLIARGFWHDRW